jgi:hypothetical protein
MTSVRAHKTVLRITALAVVMTVCCLADAQESDPRIDQLIARQQELELKLKDQDAQLKRLTAVQNDAPQTERDAPLAGYGSRVFFLRDRHDWFVIMPKARINVDWYNFLNRPHPMPGIEPNSAQDAQRAQLRDTIFLRRARLGINGTFFKFIDMKLEIEFAQIPQPGQYSINITDASGIVNIKPWLRIEAGQFYVPFTLENQTSENYTDFLDKNGPMRWAVPYPRDLGAMVAGDLPYNVIRYYLGVFNGDGQNFKNLDNQPAVIGRIVFAPLGLLKKHPSWMEDVWVGGSFWWARSDNVAGAGPPSTTASVGDLPSFSTNGGFTVFSGNYSNGTAREHLGPNGNTYKWDVELNVPLWKRFGLRSEYLHQSIDLREYDDVAAANGTLSRSIGAGGGFAHLDGWGTYVEAYAWIGHDVEIDKVGYPREPHWRGYTPPNKPTWAVQFVAKYEKTSWDITNTTGPEAGHYALDTFGLGTNLWFTKHARVMANYFLNYIGAGDPSLAAPNQKKNIFFQSFEHELLFRLQVNI